MYVSQSRVSEILQLKLVEIEYIVSVRMTGGEHGISEILSVQLSFSTRYGQIQAGGIGNHLLNTSSGSYTLFTSLVL